MREIQQSLGLTAVTISHDLALVRYVARRTLFAHVLFAKPVQARDRLFAGYAPAMYLGAIVEDGPTERVVSAPLHPYTRALVAAVPIPRVDQDRGPLPIRGNVPDARNPPSGCRFHDRCPIAVARCSDEVPLLREVAPGHRAACHLV